MYRTNKSTSRRRLYDSGYAFLCHRNASNPTPGHAVKTGAVRDESRTHLKRVPTQLGVEEHASSVPDEPATETSEERKEKKKPERQ